MSRPRPLDRSLVGTHRFLYPGESRLDAVMAPGLALQCAVLMDEIERDHD